MHNNPGAASGEGGREQAGIREVKALVAFSPLVPALISFNFKVQMVQMTLKKSLPVALGEGSEPSSQADWNVT